MHQHDGAACRKAYPCRIQKPAVLGVRLRALGTRDAARSQVDGLQRVTLISVEPTEEDAGEARRGPSA